LLIGAVVLGATVAACTTHGPSESGDSSPALRTSLSKEMTHAAAAAPQSRGAHGPWHEHARKNEKSATHRHAAQGEAMQATTLGGSVMTAPKVVPVLFGGDPYDAQVRDFFSKLGGSNYWATAVAEYGVGPATVLPPYVPSGAPPTYDGTDAWLQTVLANPPAGLPAPDNNTVYALVFPPGWGAEVGACQSFGADHWWTTMPSGQTVAYTQNPICPGGYLGMPALTDATDALSHEILEAVTDPLGSTYQTVNWALSGWGSAFEGSPSAELADLCEFQPDATYVDPQIGYAVQRLWSNSAQAAGHDPCLPHLPSRPVYFNTDALLDDGAQIYPYGYTKGVRVVPGQEKTIAVRLFADGPMKDWQLAADEEPNPHLNPDIYNELSFSWDESCGRSGDIRHLTIKRSPPPDGGAAQVFLRVAITSTSGTMANKSWLVVGTE
jgi:hypothetical protein